MGVRKRWWHDVQSQTRLIMRNVFLLSFSLIVFASCNSKRTLVDDLNESIVADAMPAIADTNAFNKQIRSLVYLLDPSCSVCIANYMEFIESLNIGNCNYDSLFTIVLNGDMMQVEYYMDRDNVKSPCNSRNIVDNEGDMTEFYYSLSEGNNILLFDGVRLLFCTSVFAYKYEPEIGLVREE